MGATEMDMLIELGRLALATALGLLIGLERGWAQRAAREGARLAGLRTFALAGLLGALAGVAGGETGIWFPAAVFLGLTGLVIAGHLIEVSKTGDYGLTTEVALLLTYVLGLMVSHGHLLTASSVAVVVTVLLGMKPQLHRWLQRLEPKEIHGLMQLALISVVLLPVLPDRGYGPWNALNPYQIWLMVVLISAISFAGYFATRIAGARRGLMLTALGGGLASSTAVSLNYARLGREQQALQGLLAAGVLAASTTMFPRILVEVALVGPALLPSLLLPLGLMTLSGYLMAWWLWRNTENGGDASGFRLRNPCELGTAIQFGILLAVILLLAQALKEWLGETGIYLLSALSGISDVDAITLSLARMSSDDTLAADAAVTGIVIAATVNTLVKAALVLVLCGGMMGRLVLSTFLAMIACGALGLYFV